MMEFRRKYLYPFLATLACISLTVIAFVLIDGFLDEVPAEADAQIDFINIAIILLTTVTVIFSVCALALAVLAVVGFRNLRREAGKFAAKRTTQEIGSAFEPEGLATQRIESEFQEEDSYLRRLIERRVRTEVIELLPLALSKSELGTAAGGMAKGEPTDEGETT